MRGVGARHAVPLLGVDLSPLQLSREVYVDDLRLRVEVVHLPAALAVPVAGLLDRKSTRLNSSHGYISYAVFCLKKKKLLYPLAPTRAIHVGLFTSANVRSLPLF